MTTPDATNRAPSGFGSRAELEADITETRDQLGRTVELLADKADVKTRARDTFRNVRIRSSNALPLGAAVASVVLGALASAVWARRS